MTHEFKEIIENYYVAKQQGIPAVLATIVDVDGSSYRRPGVGMLILKNGKTIGAVSGGCVEKEVFRQAQTVFDSGKSKIMTYDGKYRLGCEGLLYILIEPFDISNACIQEIRQHLKSRVPFEIKSFYAKTETYLGTMVSIVQFKNKLDFPFSNVLDYSNTHQKALSCFHREIEPNFRLIIIGSEHDAVKLCEVAVMTGWDVEVVCSPKQPKRLEDFPGAVQMISSSPENLQIDKVDKQTAIILMSHNFAKDLLYLQALKEYTPVYIGLLGPAKRREKLLSAFIDYFPEVSQEFINSIRGPAGLNLGAETPQEIAIAIIAEILSVVRGQKAIPLQEKKGAIHDDFQKDNIAINVIKT